MVFSMLIVLGFATWITHGIYIQQVLALQGSGNCFPTWNLKDIATFDVTSGADWEAWFGWPSQTLAGTSAECSSLSTVQFWCVIRYICLGLSVLYLLFVLINCKHINEAINCIKLAAQVMAENCSMIFQPIWNIVVKLLIILGFMVLIGFSLSSGDISSSEISISFANPADTTTTSTMKLGGVSRSFDMLYDFGNSDLYLLWVEIFMMYWWLAMIIAIEQFTTIMTIMLWFFTQSGGNSLSNAPRSNFGKALSYALWYHFGTVLFGSFLVAFIWTLITAIIV